MGEAKLIEPYYYRHSNFQNWFTLRQDRPLRLCRLPLCGPGVLHHRAEAGGGSVSGVKGRFPNGNEGYLWSNGRVRYENGALLSVTDGLGYPDDAAGSNDQGLLDVLRGHERARA